MSIERFDLGSIAPQPWKNGAGTTREIAFGGANAAEFEWRISVAQVTRDSPFSTFPGVERCITLLHGAGMRLRAPDGRVDHALATAFEPFHFSGEVALSATLIGGACSDLNVMTRRGRYRSAVAVHRSGAELRFADITLLLCCEGSWVVGPETIAPLQGLLWREPPHAIGIHPGSQNGALLHVCLCHDPTP